MAWLEKRNHRYFIAWREGAKLRRWGGDVQGWTDKAVAKSELGAFIKKAMRGEEYADPYCDQRKRSLDEHLADYISDLEAKGRDNVYVYNCEKLMRKLMDACGWKLLRDITADSFCNWRESIEVYTEGELEGLPKIGPRSQNQYLGTVRSFLKWAWKRGRMSRIDAEKFTGSVEAVDETSDVRRARRALAADEQNALLNVAGLPAEHRRLYRFIWATGLRRDEVAKLIWADIHADCTTPYVKLRAKATKARRADSVPLHPDIAKDLNDVRGDAAETDRVFPSIPTIQEHWQYIDAAGIARIDSLGRRADFHAQRTTFISEAAKVASPMETKELARHTDMRLTLKHYVDPKVFSLASAVRRMPIANGQTPPNQAKNAG